MSVELYTEGMGRRKHKEPTSGSCAAITCVSMIAPKVEAEAELQS